MEERRTERINLIEKLDKFEADFVELKIEVKESIVIYNSFITNTIDYRKNLCKKLDDINKLYDKVFTQIDKITDNCIANIPKYLEMEKHIKDEKNNKTFFKDKRFQLLLIFAASMFAFMFWLLQGQIIDSKKKIEQKRAIYGETQK